MNPDLSALANILADWIEPAPNVPCRLSIWQPGSR
jgi:hypothetical protein